MTRKINELSTPTDGLVLDLPLDGNANARVGSNDGTATSVTWGTADRGYVEEVGSFNGSSSYVDTNHTIANGNTTDFSISLNFKTSQTGVVQELINNYGTGSTDNHFEIVQQIDNTLLFGLDDGSSYDTTYADISSYLDGISHNLVVTRDRVDKKIYIDGQLLISDPYSGNVDLGERDIHIGRRRDGVRYYNGEIGLVRIYNKALSQEEINALHLEGLRKLGPTNSIQSNGFPLYSLPNLEEGKVLEYSRPQSGGSYIDQTGGGNDGTPTNVTDSANGLYNVMSFNGSSSYIEIPHSSEMASDNFTIGIQFNSDNFSSGNRRIIWKDAGGNTNGDWQLRMDNSVEMQVVFQMQNGSSELKLLSGITSADVGTWYNVVVIGTSTTATIYVNGVKKDTASFTWSNANNNNNIQLGRHSTSGTNFFDGKMSNFFYLDRNLSPTEIQQLYYSSKII